MRNVRAAARLTGGAHQPDLDRRTLLFTAIYAGFYNNVERVGMDCRRCPLLALPAGAASRALERRRATSRSLIVETIGLCHAGQGDFRQAIRAPGVRLERWPSQILPITSRDADDLKRTQRLIQEQPS